MKYKLKKAILLSFCLILIGSLNAQIEAQIMPKENANSQGIAPTAGLGGANEGNLKASGTVCPPRLKACWDIFEKMKEVQLSVSTDQQKQKALQDQVNKNESKIAKLKKEISEKIAKNKDPKKKQKELEELLKQSKDLETLNAQIAEKEKQISILEAQRVDLINGNKKEQEIEPVEEEDQTDIEPEESGYLPNGELLAWGVPYVPSIPRPRKTNSSSNSNNSNNSSSTTQAKPSDASYNALRSVEENSAKITDTDKNAFLNELDSRATASN